MGRISEQTEVKRFRNAVYRGELPGTESKIMEAYLRRLDTIMTEAGAKKEDNDFVVAYRMPFGIFPQDAKEKVNSLNYFYADFLRKREEFVNSLAN